MSNTVNSLLIERAKEVCQFFEGTDIETAILNNLEKGDLEIVESLVSNAEAEISRQEFYNLDVLPELSDDGSY